jgi:hypothetical protein
VNVLFYFILKACSISCAPKIHSSWDGIFHFSKIPGEPRRF